MEEAIINLQSSFILLQNQRLVSQLVQSAQCVQQFLTLLDLKILFPVKIDIQQNIAKVNSSQHLYIDDVLKITSDSSEGTLWLLLTQKFIVEFLLNLASTENVKSSVTDAYTLVLKERHNFFIRSVFTTGFKFIPGLEQLKAKTGLDITMEVKERVSQMKLSIDSFNILVQ
ncbi:Glycolipid transfer protein [Spironucleus salmonicida]|uniref:Glycolipid transfer protein n=1 Tax=Spironucleus salmonicida TaxID=348837 RepID=V6LA61_9EUKA|nr:Glycolipid transfer protein [Spironucleus salmonicida]|eukprot:EST41305.1 Glycolipid transfer protein domain-containing protein [Spironucleus salmonicida]